MKKWIAEFQVDALLTNTCHYSGATGHVKDGIIRNASFTDYLLPTILDRAARSARSVADMAVIAGTR